MFFSHKKWKNEKNGEKTKVKEKLKYSHPNWKLRACLAMCLKFRQIRAYRAYKLRAYKKKKCNSDIVSFKAGSPCCEP